jgi:hypothetical protein
MQILETAMNAQRLLPLFDPNMPVRAATLRSRWNELGKQFQLQTGHPLDNVLDLFCPSGSPQDLLNKAEAAADPNEKQMLYEQAAEAAFRQGNTDEVASTLPSPFPADPDYRWS